ncbi:MAG: dihydropteroate synthase [Gammaproteobacteria bacterium]|nr:dihydropteroate synthase [Gammaproteobacteria bacterium]
MTIYLGLGANDGDRGRNLERAVEKLAAAGFRLRRVSPVVESPALLPPEAKPEWHKPYLNLAVAGDADWSPQQGLGIAKKIESELGRAPSRPEMKWSPRPVDIDILRWHDLRLGPGKLTVPHADAAKRDFVLTPLLHLQPDLPAEINEGANGKSVFELTREIRPIPLWMAAVNVTPDSFSDGGAWSDARALEAHFDKLIARNVQIIDLGAESTRPGGAALDAHEEWARLKPALAMLAEKLSGRHIAPWLSLDSRNPRTLEKALRYGVNMINDVTGLADPNMQALMRDSECQAVAMHSLDVPADPANTLRETPGRGAVAQILEWAERRMETWAKARLDLNRILLDPGIGFGKTSLQCFEILSHCAQLRRAGLRLAVGHSRKSFMRALAPPGAAPADGDAETLGVSLALCEQGADVIRVHDPFLHMRAYLGWAHIAGRGEPPAPK